MTDIIKKIITPTCDLRQRDKSCIRLLGDIPVHVIVKCMTKKFNYYDIYLTYLPETKVKSLGNMKIQKS